MEGLLHDDGPDLGKCKGRSGFFIPVMEQLEMHEVDPRNRVNCLVHDGNSNRDMMWLETLLIALQAIRTGHSLITLHAVNPSLSYHQGWSYLDLPSLTSIA